ncbi:unnamed protein product [Darwinula stevensoni]|uniref:Ig-like domain-containing protein n=1 Tax=Darwinula stevensoni TaxID=69355 RepID=A0A7R8XFC0_9CRUS|nr:unnamed protein product [Darwinula stevensoni]CAG0891469.1 unnamed protein product [Darwinula stevensoni]
MRASFPLLLVPLMTLIFLTPVHLRGSEEWMEEDDGERRYSGEEARNGSEILVQLGGTALLPCTLAHLLLLSPEDGDQVSWIRRRDLHLLTVGAGAYSGDSRFIPVKGRHSSTWALEISRVEKGDEGVYECQLPTYPPQSLFLRLRVIEAEAEITGGRDQVHVMSGSKLELTCVLRQATQSPEFLFWYRGDTLLNFRNDRPDLAVKTKGFSSVLTIERARKEDSGNYSCVPDKAKPASVLVHVIHGENPAPMQQKGGGGTLWERKTLFGLLTYIFVFSVIR